MPRNRWHAAGVVGSRVGSAQAKVRRGQGEHHRGAEGGDLAQHVESWHME